MRSLWAVVLVLLTGLTSTSTFALSSSSEKGSASLTDSRIYETNCARCHGKNGGGKHLFGGPSLVSGEVRDLSSERLADIIANGKGRMPKFAGKLTPAQIETLVRAIKASQPSAVQK